MILKLLVALTRWAWGVSPAFYTVKTPVSEDDGTLMVFGLAVDVVVAVVVAMSVPPELVTKLIETVGRWWRAKQGGAK